jgi:hypothetical protein
VYQYTKTTAEQPSLETLQRREVEQRNLTELLYYVNGFSEDGSRACVVLLMNPAGGVEARGVSVCSPQDNFVKATGRLIARGRALRAVKRRSNSKYIKPYAGDEGSLNDTLGILSGSFECLSEYLPKLTEYEQERLQ